MPSDGVVLAVFVSDGLHPMVFGSKGIAYNVVPSNVVASNGMVSNGDVSHSILPDGVCLMALGSMALHPMQY